MKELIKKYVREHRYVTLAELEYYFEQNNIEFKGTKCIWFNQDMNWLLWANMSEEYMNTILELEKEKIIDFVPCHTFVYLIDGVIANLPVVKSAVKYTKPHWIPCVLN